MAGEIDKFDESILCELDNNARIHASVISRRIHISKEAVSYRIRNLIRKGYILQFHTIINASLFGYHYAWVQLKFQQISRAKKNEIVAFLLKKPSVANIRVFEGYFDIAFLTLFRTEKELKSQLDAISARFGWDYLDKKVHLILASHKFNVMKDGELIRTSLPHGVIGNISLAPLDYKILKKISSGSRMSVLELARATHSDPGSVRYHMKKLEQEKVIVRYTIVSNIELFKKEYHQIIISVKKQDSVPDIINFFSSSGSCLYAYELIGDFDLSMNLVVNTIYDLRRILEGFRDRFSKEYIRYSTGHIIEEHKVNWSPFD